MRDVIFETHLPCTAIPIIISYRNGNKKESNLLLPKIAIPCVWLSLCCNVIMDSIREFCWHCHKETWIWSSAIDLQLRYPWWCGVVLVLHVTVAACKERNVFPRRYMTFDLCNLEVFFGSWKVSLIDMVSIFVPTKGRLPGTSSTYKMIDIISQWRVSSTKCRQPGTYSSI